jgi:hypothetical protein
VAVGAKGDEIGELMAPTLLPWDYVMDVYTSVGFADQAPMAALDQNSALQVQGNMWATYHASALTLRRQGSSGGYLFDRSAV